MSTKPTTPPPPPTSEEKTIIYLHDDKAVVPASNRFITGYAPVIVDGLEIRGGLPRVGPVEGLSPMSYEDWCQIVSFHRWVVEKWSCEAIISHLIDRDLNWHHVPFHQEVRRNAMTIDVDYTSEANQALLEKLREEHGIDIGDFHGSTHNHVTTSAFASGTDHEDETHKQGLHVTVGKMDQAEIDIDARLRVNFSPKFDEETGEKVRGGASYLFNLNNTGIAKFIEVPGLQPDMPVELAKELIKYNLARCPDNGFPDEWRDMVTLKTYQSGYTGGTGTGYRNSSWSGNSGAGQTTGWQQEWPWMQQQQDGKTGTPSPPPAKTSTTALAQRPTAVNGAKLVNTTTPASEKDVEDRQDNGGGSDHITKERYRKYFAFMCVLRAFADFRRQREHVMHWLTTNQDKPMETWLENGGPDGFKLDIHLTEKVKDEGDCKTALALAQQFLEECPSYLTEKDHSMEPASRRMINAFLDKVDAVMASSKPKAPAKKTGKSAKT
jgi:hypothetical protein